MGSAANLALLNRWPVLATLAKLKHLLEARSTERAFLLLG